VDVPLDAQLHREGDQVTLLNISEGGFLMSAPSDFPERAIWEFRFGLANADPLVMRGRIAHTMRTTSAGEVAYIVGVEFVDDGSEAHAADVRRLIRAAQGR
jgi:hypothetical protein